MAKRQGRKLLLIHEDIHLARRISERLNAHSHRITVLSSKDRELISEIAAVAPDLIIYGLSEGDLRHDAWLVDQVRTRFNLPLVYLTPSVAALNDNVFCEGQALPQFVTKPYRTKDLSNAIDIALKAATMERAFSEQDKLFNAIVTHIPSTIMVIQAGLCQYINSAGMELLGYKRAEEIMGLPVSALLRPESKELIDQHLVNLHSVDAKKTAILELIHKNGEIRLFEIVFVPLSFGEAPAALLLGEEISERLRTQQELEDLTWRYQALSDVAADFVYTVRINPDGTVTPDWVTDGIIRVTGYSLDEIMAQGGLFAILPSEEAEVARKDMENLLAGKSSEREMRIRDRNGEDRWLSVYRRPVFDSQARVSGVIGSVQDITERKRTERALRRANKELNRYIRQLEQVNREVLLLNEMGDLLQNCRSVAEACSVFGDIVERLFPHAGGMLYLRTETGNLLEARVRWGQDTIFETLFAAESCWALRLGRVHATLDIGTRMRCAHTRQLSEDAMFKPYLCTPVSAQGEILGLLSLQSEPSFSIQRWESLAITTAERFALAVANLRLREELRQQSLRDPLTGLFNRRFLEQTLERELFRAIRKNRPVSLVMIDLDHLKLFNDTFGHDAGDELLVQFSLYLERNFRSGDVVCRYGGDEFAIILPDISLNDAVRRMVALREGLDKLGQEFIQQADLPRITLSAGIACAPDQARSLGALVRAADQALYQAKHQGRDRVVVAGD